MGRRRGLLLATLAAVLAVAAPALAQAPKPETAAGPPYGLIGKFTARPGQRDALISALIDGSSNMPGCLSYIVAKDAKDPDGVWVTELWNSRTAHDASLKLDQVKAAIAKGRPLIASMSDSHETVPVGGQVLGEK